MRYKEFNRNKVLEKCIPLFWKNGFRACAISDIVNETGVNRFSLYEEFTNKESILLAALHLYKNRYSHPKLTILNTTDNVMQALTKFYHSFLQNAPFQEGCFVIHVGTELADTDMEVKKFMTSYLNEIEIQLRNLLQKDAHTRDKSDFYARHLIGLFCTTMSFCLIQSDTYRRDHIKNGINVILNKEHSYA